MRRTITAIGGLLVLLSATSAAAAPSAPTINDPTFACGDISNEITVTGSVTTDAELASFYLQVDRWEDVNPTMPGWAPRFAWVEYWGADFGNSKGKGTTVPTFHELVTGDPGTWNNHGKIVEGYYTESSEVFVIHVIVTPGGNSKKSGSVWGQWTVDCGANSPEVVSFTYPYDVPWESD